MTNEELVALIQEGVDVTENMGLLYQQNIPLIEQIISPLANLANGSAVIDKSDLMQDAYIGLAEAAKRYDPSKGASFMTFAAFHIKTAARKDKENIQGAKRIPSYMLELIAKYHFFKNKSISECGVEPTQIEMMAALEVKKPKLDAIEKIIHELQSVSLDSFVPGSENATYAETISDEYNLEEAVSDEMTLEHYKKAVWDAVSELPDGEKDVIIKRFQEELSLQEIADEKQLSAEEISNLQNRGFRLLRRKKKIQEAALEYGYSSYLAYHYGVQRCKDTRSSSTEYVALKHLEMESKIKTIEAKIDSLNEMLKGVK